MVEVNRIMAILRRTIGFLGLAAALALSPAVSQAEVVLINGTVSYTSLFGPLPARSVAAWGTQTAGGALNVPNEIHQNFSSMGTTNFSSGVVLTFMNTRVLTGFGPGQLAAGHQPGGLAQPATFAPATSLPGATITVGPSILNVGYKSAGGNHFGGVLALAGFEINQGLFQTSPAFLIRQAATRGFSAAGGVTGANPTKRDFRAPETALLTPVSQAVISNFTGVESRIGFPWTTGSISGVAQIGPAFPYGGAGNIGTPAAPAFQTVAGFDGRTFNATANTLTGNLQLVSPMLQVANYALSGPGSLAPFWTLDVTIVPEPGAVAALVAGLGFVAVAGFRRLRA